MKKRLIAILAALMLISQASFAEYSQEDLQKFNLYYNNGVSYLKNQRYTSAIVEFKKVLRYQPFDTTVKQSLCSSYLARADYYLNSAKDPKKAISDLKSALFYMKYWGKDDNTPQLSTMAGSTQTSLAALQRKYEANMSAQQRFQNAKTLRAQGELPAAGYEFMVLSNNSQYAKSALENAGDIYKALNNNLNAIECYRDALKADPKDAKLHFKYAVILDEANNEEAAAEEYNMALKYGEKNIELLDVLENLWRSRTINNPNDAQAFVNLGTVFQTRGDLVSAKNQYLKALSLAPDDKTAILNLASLYNAQGDITNTIAQYNKLLAKNPNDLEIISYKAAAYESLKDYKNAMAQYKSILAISPNNAEAKAAIADIVGTKFNPQDRYNYMLLEANSNPQNYDLQYAYAYEMHRQKRYDEALNFYKRALAINPKKPEIYINMAQIYTIKNDYQSALNTINSGVNAIPYSAELIAQKDDLEKSQAGALFENASKYYEAKNYKLALQDYLKIPQQTPEVQMAIASCYYELKDYNNAALYYEKVIQKDQKNEEAMYFCAMAYSELNNSSRAIELLNRIIAINPSNVDAKNAIAAINDAQFAKNLEDAITLFEKKDYTGSMNLLNKVQTQDPKNAYAAYYKGAIFEEQNKLKDANAQYKLAISYDPNFTLAYYSYAVSLDNLEKYQEALSAYDKFLELKVKEGPEDEYAKFAKSRAAELRKFLNTKQ